MKVVVTGGAGYIGSHAVQRLLDNDYEVIVIDDLSTGWESLISPFATKYKVDIKNYDALDAVFSKEKDISAIFHFAALISVHESTKTPLKYYENNTFGTLNILKVMKKHNIKNIIFSSTAAVYGNPIDRIINEDSPTLPINPYGDSKLAAEKIIKNYAKVFDFNYIIFRYFNVAGLAEGMKHLNSEEQKISQDHLIPRINMFLLGLRDNFSIYGDDYNTKDGSCIRDYVHVVDLVDAHILGFEWSLKNNKSDTFNLGTKDGYSVKEIVKKTEEVLNIKVNVKTSSRRIGDPDILISDNSKVESILNWRPKHSLKEIIESDYIFRK